jgi:pyruvate kinase
LFWGVIPLVGGFYENSDVMIDMSVKAALAKNLVHQGESVVVTAGIPTGTPGSTNMIKVVHLGKKLLTGIGIGKQTVNGKACYCSSETDFKDKLQKGMILVVKSLSDEQVKYATKAAAIITEEKGLTSPAAILGINSEMPVIVNAKEAAGLITDGTEITVDTASGVIYEGNINV